jgi:hypothetical protein
MSETTLWRLWGRDADYALGDATDRPEGAEEAVSMLHREVLRDLLGELVHAYPGNVDVLREAMQRTSAAADRDVVELVASRIAAGLAHLWRFPHPAPRVATRRVEIVRLADLAEPQREVDTTTWIGVTALDQYGRKLPWMRARLGLPDGRTVDKRLDAGSHTGADRLSRSGVCWVEVQAEEAVKQGGPFVDAVEPPRPVDAPAASWIGIQVVDQYGRPLPWMMARVSFADGAERQPLLDADAAARVDAFAAGACSVELQAGARQAGTPS